MTLPDLIDLETQLARDREADPASLGARDRALLAGAPAGAPRGELLARWLAALRDREPGRGWPGRRVAAALGTTRTLLVVAGLALGWAAATALLRGGDAHPVNVWDFLLGLVGVQLVLLVLLLASFFLPLAAVGEPLAGLVHGGVAALLRRLAAQGSSTRSAELRALWHRLRSRRSLYHHVEPWLLLGTTQAFGVAFNVGALAAFFRLVVFSDLSFAWSTTLLDLDAAAFQALARALATPWAALWPDAVPTIDLVERTRYSHLEAAYLWPGVGGVARPEAVGGWWPFLAAALACYGLLPRVALLALSSWRTRRALRRLPLDDAEVTRLVRRLAEPHVETRAPLPEGVPAQAPRAAGVPTSAHAPSAHAAILLWRDAPGSAALAAAVAHQARCAPAAPIPVNGAPLAPAIAAAEVVIVLAESWEAPDKATLRFLRDLRAAAGPGRHVTIVLVDTAAGAPRAPGSDELRIWREQLAALEDPWLAVEPYAEAA